MHIKRIAATVSFILLLSASKALSQTAADSTNNNCVILRIDYCSNWITTSYGGGKTELLRLERSKQLPIKDQIGDINNTLANVINKLGKEGYRIVTSTSDVNDGNTCGITFILYRQ